MTNNKTVYLEIGGERFELGNALIGANMVKKDNQPFSVYAGSLDIAELGVSLLHIMRAVIKINREEQFMPLETSKEFIEYTLLTALKMEARANVQDYVKSRNVDEFVKKYMTDQF